MDFETRQTAGRRERNRLALADHRDVLGIGEESARSAAGVAA